MAVFHCVIASPQGVVFEGDVTRVTVPATDGELGVLAGHAPLIAELGYGELRVTPSAPAGGGAAGHGPDDPGGVLHFFVEGGFAQVFGNQMSVLVSTVERLDSVRRAEAEERVHSLLEAKPDRNASFQERDAYDERVEVARRRAKLARG